MNQLPTAEELYAVYGPKDVLHAMREFAKLHVQAALKAVGSNYDHIRSSMCPEEEVTKSYPLENIK